MKVHFDKNMELVTEVELGQFPLARKGSVLTLQIYM